MWVFGYGSLMWDGWEADHRCLRRVTAELKGYSRTFNKRSVRNWGTRLHPGPTLNLVASNTSCRGVAFEFPESSRAKIVAYLVQREGKHFTLSVQTVVLEGGIAVTALVPLYQGANLIPPTSTSEIAAVALRANGKSGSCADYIKGMADHLQKLGICDPAVVLLRQVL